MLSWAHKGFVDFNRDDSNLASHKSIQIRSTVSVKWVEGSYGAYKIQNGVCLCLLFAPLENWDCSNLSLQLVSEFVILAIRPEDEGSFFCSAQNSAGVARANFTVRVVESLTEGGGGAASLPDNSNSPPAGGSPGGLQENTNLLNKGDADMFKVRTRKKLSLLTSLKKSSRVQLSGQGIQFWPDIFGAILTLEKQQRLQKWTVWKVFRNFSVETGKSDFLTVFVFVSNFTRFSFQSRACFALFSFFFKLCFSCSSSPASPL